jgi:molecular chaperone DnaK
MEPILGIDLGTTNSVVAIWSENGPIVLTAEDGKKVLPSAVGLDSSGNRLVGTPAKNQALLAPERTVLSVKRSMGEEKKFALGDQTWTPQEISAVILRTLKERAEAELGQEVRKAVITVPAFFNDVQRAATKQAGELAGLDVIRIINEPTAAALIYDPNSPARERLLVYDLGGGTFDVSIVQVEASVVEVLSSHGDTRLGGDDFDQLLLNHVADRFAKDNDGVDLRANPASRSRLLQAVETAKCQLSFEPYVTLAEAFIIQHKGRPLNLEMTIDREDYESLIEPLLRKTIGCVDDALRDAKLLAKDIDKVILVGGSTRTPLVHQMLEDLLDQVPHAAFDPDLCVAMGAAVQAGLISGADVSSILVDITPHTLGVRCATYDRGTINPNHFSRLIHRNSALPATRGEVYHTVFPGQEMVCVEVYQGEDDDVTFNQQIGEFELTGLDTDAVSNNEIVVRFDLDLNGTLNVTAIERATRLEKQITIDNAVNRFRAKDAVEAKGRLAEQFGFSPAPSTSVAEPTSEKSVRFDQAEKLMAKVERLKSRMSAQDLEEVTQLTNQWEEARQSDQRDRMRELEGAIDDFLFYLED